MMKIVIENEKAEVYTPYNPEFVSKVKKIRSAKWNAEKKAWLVPATSVDVIRTIMEEVYGYNDITENDSITLEITVNSYLYADKSDVVLFGKVLSHAWGRDSGGKAGDDVYFLKGEPTSGGSFKNWDSRVADGSVIRLVNVNKKLYEKGAEKYADDITVVEIKDKIDRKALEDEKERLLLRVKEIDKMLETA